MPKFAYTAQSMDGKKKRGALDARDEAELYAALKTDGLFVLEAKELRRGAWGRKLKTKQLAEFCRQLGTMLGAGISLARALSIAARAETIGEYERSVYQELLRSVRQGVSLSDSMDAMGGVFPELLINMFRTAEIGGSMDKVAMRMAVYYEKQYRLNKKVSGAMTYPAILLVLIVLVFIFIVSYILPQFQSLFDRMGELPATTRFLIGLSDAFKNNGAAIVVWAAFIVVCLIGLCRLKPVRLALDRLRVHFPVSGKLRRVIYTARFARTLCSLYTSGLPIVSALTIGCRTIGNTYIEKQFDRVIALVRGGTPLSQALLGVDGFVRKLADSVMVGEETGSLDGMLESTADTMEYESEMALTRLVTLLEPVLIILMAAIIGFVMVSVMLPIFQYYSSIETMAYT